MELSGKVTKDLGDISEKKKEEVEGEEAFQAKFGPRTPSQVCAALWKDASNYQTYHNQAVSPPVCLCVHASFVRALTTVHFFVQSKSNTELKSMFDQNYTFLVLLSGPLASLQATVPKMTPMDGKYCNYCTIINMLLLCICSAPEENGSDSERWQELMVSQ